MKTEVFKQDLHYAFARVCQSVLRRGKILEPIRKAIDDQNLAFYICSIWRDRFDENDDHVNYNLSYCVCHLNEEGGENDAANWTTLADLVCRDRTNAELEKIDNGIKSDQLEAITEQRFGHWLADSVRVPMAVFLEYSLDQAWDVSFAKHSLIYAIRASSKNEKLEAAVDKLSYYQKMRIRPQNNLKALQEMLDKSKSSDKEEDNYMGRIIKSSINVPVLGNPSVTFQVLSRRRLRFYTEEWSNPEMWDGTADQDDRFISLEQVMALRLAAERFQGLLLSEISGAAAVSGDEPVTG